MASHLRRNLPEPATIASIPGVMGGVPCIEGTRIPAETLLACLNGGDTVYDIYRGYPYLPYQAVEAVVEWAKANDRDIQLPVRRVPDAGFGSRRK